jgi:HSP20 family molecular chaperone IbpA
MGRIPHATWGASWWSIGLPSTLLLVLIGLGLLALLVLAMRGRKPAANRAREPQVDVLDQDQEIVLVVELPGVRQEEIQIDVEDDVVFIETRGERRYAKAEILPDPVDATTLRTGYENGLLTIRLTREDYDLQRQPTAPELATGA